MRHTRKTKETKSPCALLAQVSAWSHFRSRSPLSRDVLLYCYKFASVIRRGKARRCEDVSLPRLRFLSSFHSHPRDSVFLPTTQAVGCMHTKTRPFAALAARCAFEGNAHSTLRSTHTVIVTQRRRTEIRARKFLCASLGFPVKNAAKNVKQKNDMEKLPLLSMIPQKIKSQFPAHPRVAHSLMHIYLARCSLYM